jgi:hypothetical protein
LKVLGLRVVADYDNQFVGGLIADMAEVAYDLKNGGWDLKPDTQQQLAQIAAIGGLVDTDTTTDTNIAIDAPSSTTEARQ